ncbi:phenylacetate--CoA ligase family protein (plasmid) [Rhodococcus pseudokoreensis]|uniref:Phenylacetate--CoA ligase family protein n=1 Tax=Rhodococcus pseudokoreensis TaxID=2811421 RepID=A0A974VYD9_9NOCA|nr:phenylacetate--CoA ligase family protein [Rhodococcus pseudokoreensis]QSE87427.1 phenylacetate--CoA ligase family protein [Rhodococcus pseudokoreensis]
MTTPLEDKTFWNSQTQTASREELDAIHLSKIRNMVAWAYEASPLHRRLYDQAAVKPSDIVTWDDFHHKLPFTDKPDYLADQDASPNGFGGVALGPEHWQQYFHTTGTTGHFMNETFSQYEMQKAGSQYCYALHDYGMVPGDSMYFCFNWGNWIGLWSFYWGARDFGLQIISGGGLSTEDRIKQIVKLKPTIVVATPTYLLHLAEVALGMGVDLRDSGVRMVAGGGEAGLSIPATREHIGEIWGVGDMVMDAYGVGEALMIGQSCKKWGGGVHIIEDVCHSYVADPQTGVPLLQEDAVGEHVITSYTHFSQPFIKYRTHDLVRRTSRPDHRCGWNFAHLPGVVLGRADYMVTIRGVNVYPTAVENLLGDVAGLTSHYELHISRASGFDRMLVKVEAHPETHIEHGELERHLNAHLRDCLGVRLETEVLPAETLPRYELKTKRIFDHRTDAERPTITLGQK